MTLAFLQLNDLPLTFETTVKRSTRNQRIQFGDGYTQILTDGLNAEQEVWACRTPTLPSEQAWAIEAYFLRNRGNSLSWSPPDSTKSFEAAFSAGTLTLGYTNLANVELRGYSRPADYTANTTTGVLTAVTIASNALVYVTLTSAAKSYIIEDGWQLDFIAPELYSLSFSLRRVYV